MLSSHSPSRRAVLGLGITFLAGSVLGSWTAQSGAAPGPVRQVTFLRRKAGMSREAFLEYWIKVHTPLAAGAPGLSAYSQTLLPADNEAGFDGIASRYFATEADRAAFAASPHAAKVRADAPNFIDVVTAPPLDVIADEVVVVPETAGAWLRGTGQAEGPRIKGVALLTRRANVTREAFLKHWHEVHAQLAVPCPGLARYVQLAIRPRPDLPYDGIAELYFENQEAFELFDMSWEKVALQVDGANIMEQGPAMVGDELMSLPENWKPVWSAT